MATKKRPAKIPLVLESVILTHMTGQAADYTAPLTDSIIRTYRGSVLAICHYGSCLQKGSCRDGIADLFIVVDSYTRCYQRLIPALANRLLPPNVYYLESQGPDGSIRAKCAVITLDQLERQVSSSAIHSFFWARFAQPMALSFYRDHDSARRMAAISARALLTFSEKTLPCLERRFTVEQLWRTGLGLTYRAELRPEGPERFDRLWRASEGYFLQVTPLALSALGIRKTGSKRLGEPLYEYKEAGSSSAECIWPWRARIAAGKILSILRLMKAAFTFKGGVDYALWKIRRHTGQEIQAGPFLKRHPILAMIVLSWRLFRSRAIR